MASAKRITDKEMNATAGTSETWYSEPFDRGSGVFMGRVTPKGERLFYYRYTDPEGRRPFLRIGAYNAKGKRGVTLQKAREKAQEWSKLYASGVHDLREHFERESEKRKAEEEAEKLRREHIALEQVEAAAAAARRVTIEQLFEQWAKAELRPQMQAGGTSTGRKDGGEWVRQSFQRRVFTRPINDAGDLLGDVPVEVVTKATLLEVLDDCKAQGKARTANVLLTDLQQMLRFAVDREIIVRSPLEGITKAKVGGKETLRSRVLSEDDLRTLWAAVPSALSERSAAAVWLILATATRVGEALGARWEHVNLEARTWYLPDTKNQRDHTIHLSELAVRQFHVLHSLRPNGADGSLCTWVFPNAANDGPVCPKSLTKQLGDRQRPAERRMSHRAKDTSTLIVPGGKWTPHDLRRTAATMMARLGFSSDVIDECLNHKITSKVARVYIQDRRLADQARAFDALGAAIVQTTTGEKQRTKVHQLHVA